MLLQFIGLTSIALFLPPAIWGLTLVNGEVVSQPRHRLAMWTLSLILIASTLSILPQPQGWLLTHGLGGLIGDFGRSVFMGIGGIFNQRLAGAIGGALSGALGLWALLRASSLSGDDLRLLWHWTSRRRARRDGWLGAGVAYAFYGARRVSERVAGAIERDAAPRRGGPRGYWQAEDPDRFTPRPGPGSFNPRFDDFDTEEDRTFTPPPTRRGVAINPPRLAPAPAAQRIEPYFDSSRTIPRQRPQTPDAMIPPPRAPQPMQIRHAPPVQRPDWDEPDYESEPLMHAAVPDVHLAAPVYQDLHYEDEEAAYEPSPPPAPVYRSQRPAPRAQPEPGRSVVEHRSRLDDIEPGAFVLPPLKLLSPAPARHNDPELSDAALGRRAELLQGVLEDFGVKGEITDVRPGPVVTLYELEPAPRHQILARHRPRRRHRPLDERGLGPRRRRARPQRHRHRAAQRTAAKPSICASCSSRRTSRSAARAARWRSARLSAASRSSPISRACRIC